MIYSEAWHGADIQHTSIWMPSVFLSHHEKAALCSLLFSSRRNNIGEVAFYQPRRSWSARFLILAYFSVSLSPSSIMKFNLNITTCSQFFFFYFFISRAMSFLFSLNVPILSVRCLANVFERFMLL